jgi:hypothetical protein
MKAPTTQRSETWSDLEALGALLSPVAEARGEPVEHTVAAMLGNPSVMATSTRPVPWRRIIGWEEASDVIKKLPRIGTLQADLGVFTARLRTLWQLELHGFSWEPYEAEALRLHAVCVLPGEPVSAKRVRSFIALPIAGCAVVMTGGAVVRARSDGGDAFGFPLYTARVATIAS